MRVYYNEENKTCSIKEKKSNSLYSGRIICISETDELTPFSYGAVYPVVGGVLCANNGVQLSGITSIEGFSKNCGVEFREVKGYEKFKEIYFTGVLYCIDSKDYHTFKPGYLYPVVNGIVDVPGFTDAIPYTGKDFVAHLEKDFPAKFAIVTRYV